MSSEYPISHCCRFPVSRALLGFGGSELESFGAQSREFIATSQASPAIAFLMYLFAICSTPLLAQDAKAPDPVIRRVQVETDGALTVFVAISVPVIETRVVDIEIDVPRLEFKSTSEGVTVVEVIKKETVTATYKVNVPRVEESKRTPIPMGNYFAVDTKGQTVDNATLKDRFKTPGPAIVSDYNSSVVDAWSLSLFKDNAIVFIVKPTPAVDDEDVPPIALPPSDSADSNNLPSPAKPKSTKSDFELVKRLIMNRDQTDGIRKTAITTATQMTANDNGRGASLKAELHQLIDSYDATDDLRSHALASLLSFINSSP